ncbi:CS1-pili formation C-terminal domain-containing protein [Kosakonia sp.]|uniref:CS1-pili formation C-terminal domain-containing protein n=1 Tax=Kosakonia sp. TaxID=1916651 RepID=UPI00289A6BF1|nr:CS1-pili formation C-terminal domain-containing protein [Kosakonia sp.]
MFIMDRKAICFLIAFTTMTFNAINNACANNQNIINFGGVIIPETFNKALHDGMNIPLFIHLNNAHDNKDDQRIGRALILMDDNTLKIRRIELERHDENAHLNDETSDKLIDLTDVAFDQHMEITLNNNAFLHLNFQQLTLQLVIKPEALATLLQKHTAHMGASSGKKLSSALNYVLGIYSNQTPDGDNNTSSYLSLNEALAMREHHIFVDGTLYGMGTAHQQTAMYKAMYERDFAGYRFAAGMLDTWNLQSLGPITAISSGKAYGFSWGNNANSTVFDSSHSVTPIIAFFPSAGEALLYRDNKLLSIQNFNMGSHEIDTRGLPHGIYDITVEVVVNGKTINKSIQRVNKIFSQNTGAGIATGWQIWGGRIHMNDWYPEEGNEKKARDTTIIGVSSSGMLSNSRWMATGYNYNSLSIVETNLSLPVDDFLNINLQNMASSDRSWSLISNMSMALPGGFSSIWVSQEKTNIGNALRRNRANNRAVGLSLNGNMLWSRLGSLSASYNEDRYHKSHYYLVDYAQPLYNGVFGSLGLRLGVQRYETGLYSNSSSIQKYVALDFSLPLGNWLRTGMTHQDGYTAANIAVQKTYDEGIIRNVGADISHVVSGSAQGHRAFSGGAGVRYESRLSSGTVNVNSGADGYINANLTSSGSIGWQGKEIVASGSNEGNAGIIIRTDIEDEGQLSARVNGRAVQLTGSRNYIPLQSYNTYEIEIQNSKNSLDSYDISSGRKSSLTLYPGNVVIIEPTIKQIVTVFGRIHAEDGTSLANAPINNHVGRAQTDNNGEFVMDVDKKYPVIDFYYGNNKRCETELDISDARGAIWVGDVICRGLKSYASTTPTEFNHAG